MAYHHEYQLPNSSSIDAEPNFIPKKIWPNRGILITLGLLATIGIVLCAHFTLSVTNNSLKISENKLPSTQAIKLESLYEENFKSSLNQSQKDVIDLVRKNVADKVTHEFMKTDSYLVRWLRAREWNVEDATDMLIKHLNWREEFNMDNVLGENLTYYENEYVFYLDGFDNNKGPVASMNLGEWDLRKVSVTGQENQFLRYAFSHFEKGIQYIYECQSKGMQVSQGVLIINAAKFSMKQQGCYTCLSLLTNFFFGLDDNYPGWLHHFFLINTPDMADFVVELLVPYLSGENREALKVYGFNKHEWQPKILSLIPANQIRPEFGGTKVDSTI